MHTPCAAGFYFVCTFDPSRNFYWSAVGENCVQEMIRELNSLAERCVEEMRKNERMVMTKEDNEAYYSATCCHVCKGHGFTTRGSEMKVRDHDHRTGRFRGAAHSKCNINYFANRYLPVIFHNLKGYDSHHIIREAYKINKDIGQKDINVIPNSFEKFMSFSIGNLKFIDSFQFMSSSLEKLTENLYDGQDRFKHFHNVKKFFPEHLDLVCQKGYFPYEWLDSLEKLSYKGVPPREAFDNALGKSKLNDKEYEHVQAVYRRLDIQEFQDYMLTYLKTDVLLLADIFTSFRQTCISYYQLDPANYLSAPSLAWDAMMLKTGIELDQITDLKTLDFIERMKRGGLCFVGSKRQVRANNKYLKDFDPNKPSTFIMYWDANNLYGWAMSQVLPYKDLKFVKKALEEILATPDDAEVGYAVRCYLRFPRELHDKFKEFPPAPENLNPEMEWFSDYQRELGQKLKTINDKEKYKGCDKLIPHLFDHKDYVLHYRNLKFLVALGVEVVEVHEVLSFKQKAWLKPYIDFNTEKRKEARNDFEKDFFKLMNNAVFGKTMENVKNRMQLHLTTDHDNAVKWFSKANFKDSKFFRGLHLIEMYKTEIECDKPIYVGTSILDLSKLCMMDFHYNVIQKHFQGRYHLIYSDTDSFVYCLVHEDIYDWIKKNPQHFDLSDSVRADMRDNTNKKVLGKFKDEMSSLLLKQFTGLNPKVYSMIHQHKDEEETYHEDYITKKCKGVSKVVVKKGLNHEDYDQVLATSRSKDAKVMGIRSFDHQLYTVEQNKTALTSWYDKMVMTDSINCHPFGYDPV
jgi:hypothetical protein